MKHYKIIGIILIIAFVGFFGGYSAWNAARPEHTCARCHEINPSFHSWQTSAHRDIKCVECHGTALSNGLHSLQEKGNMVLTHFTGNQHSTDVRMNEEQILATMDACIRCHQTEFAHWNAGGHSTSYSRIFLDESHNHKEQLYWDCLRCHGMFYEGTIYDLVEPISTSGPWKLKDEKMANQPVIPCMTCHQIHTENEPYPQFAERIEYNHAEPVGFQNRFNAAALFVRSDKQFLRADMLPMVDFFHKGNKINVSNDPLQRLCIQCHAPNFMREAGSEDNRTTFGVHEGLSCVSCHNVHSGNARNSCVSCHPAISNCGLDVTTMNTTFLNPDSEHNIHFVSCEDCH